MNYTAKNITTIIGARHFDESRTFYRTKIFTNKFEF